MDFFVYIICIAGVLISLNFFRLDLFRTLTRRTEQPVGVITSTYKAAQRRFSDRVLWDRLRRESPVYNGDFIRTGGLSEATIAIAGGAVIALAENSLVQLHVDDTSARVDISGGGVSVNAADSGSALILASGGSQVRVESGAVVSAGVDGEDFRFRVVEGNASFSGEPPPAAREAAALYPRPAAGLINPGPEKLTVPFRWDRTNLDPEEPVLLEIAEDRNFSRLVFAEDFTGDSAVAELVGGSYFWRVSAGGGPVSSFDTFSLKVIDAPPPVLIAPVEGYQYRFRVKRPPVRFQWREQDGAASYVLEAADNPEMANPAFVREAGGASLYASELGPGTWYWRVRPVFPAGYEGNAGQGKPASFRIIQTGELGPPELQSPADRGLVNLAANRGDLYFSWRREAEAQSYSIRISKNRDLSSPVIAETVGDNFYVYRRGQNAVRPGQYFWAVLQTDTEGNDSNTSPVRSFTAVEEETVQRTVFPPDGYSIGTTMMPDIRFTWKTNLPFETRFQVSGRADFSRLEIDEAVSGETIQGRILTEGVWYWRILARGNDGAVFETPRRSFITAPSLPAPVPVKPGALVLIAEREPVGFSWTASPGAEYYQFKLYREEDRTRAVYENDLVQGTALNLSMDGYPDGAYYWTVQGFAAESPRSTRLIGLLAGSGFNARKIRPVSLDYPADGTEFEGLQAYLEPGSLRWSRNEPTAASSRFILSQNRDFTGRPAVMIENPPGTIPLPRLRAGNYYWTIRAETTDGFDISARAPRFIRVLPTPPLPEAEGRLPEDGTVITGADLRQNRKISFSWQPVPGAGGYLFILIKEGENKELLSLGPLTETSFTLEDFTLLDVGTFIWRVEAVLPSPVQEDRGALIRRGETGENRFKIDFALPKKPDLQKPGILYGRE
ncbi:MAG: FecR family protein [Treponema sp.]|jgi:hypothetical protein|nr:FecR family protein [Treponema sp.]